MDEAKLAADIAEIKLTLKQLHLEVQRIDGHHGTRITTLEQFRHLHETWHARADGEAKGRGDMTANVSARDKWLIGIGMTLITLAVNVAIKLL